MQSFRQYYHWINAVLFQLAWFACVLGGNSWALPVVLAFIALHSFFAVENEWRFVAQVAVLGWFFDQILMRTELLQVDIDPWWLHSLWLLFAMTINHGHRFLQKSLALAFVLGGIAGPLAYFAGTQLTDASVGVSLPLFFAILAPAWAVMMVLVVFMAQRQLKPTVGR